MGDRVMRSLEENMESLSRAMASEAKAEAEQAVAEARVKADAIRKKGQEQAEAVRSEVMLRAHQDADRLRGQVIATTQMKARTMELDHREKLLDKVFGDSRKQLPSVQQWTDYNQIALRLLHEALGDSSIGIILVTGDVAEMIRTRMDQLQLHSTVPLVVEIQAPAAVQPEQPSLNDIVFRAIGVKI